MLDPVLRHFFTPRHQKYRAKAALGQFPYVPLPAAAFRDLLLNAPRDKSFVDAGCGTGDKLLLAYLYGFSSVTGIDNEKAYLRQAHRLLPASIILRHADIRRINYAAYDVIYFYRPFEDLKRERRFEEHVWETAKPGAYILLGMQPIANCYEAAQRWYVKP